MLDRIIYSYVKRRFKKRGFNEKDIPPFEDVMSAIGEIQRVFRFNPQKSFLSREIETKLELKASDSSFVNFISEDYPGLSFYIHALEFRDKAEYVYWDGLAQKEENATFKGRYYPNLFSNGEYKGAIETHDRSIDVILRNHRVIGLRTYNKKTEDAVRAFCAFKKGVESLFGKK